MVLSDISIRRPVFATVINLVVLLIGIIAYDRLAVRLIPNVDTPVVTVNTSYPGASAQVIESQITQPIEDALSGVEGIEYISSVSREQSSQVTIRFHLDRDPGRQRDNDEEQWRAGEGIALHDPSQAKLVADPGGYDNADDHRENHVGGDRQVDPAGDQDKGHAGGK